jgi:hypothetical protein
MFSQFAWGTVQSLRLTIHESAKNRSSNFATVKIINKKTLDIDIKDNVGTPILFLYLPKLVPHLAILSTSQS